MYSIKRLGLILLFLSSWPLLGQPVSISIKVLQSVAPEAILYKYIPNGTQPVDTARLAHGKYNFYLDDNHSKGLYKIAVGRGIIFDIIVGNEKHIDISTVVYAPEDSLKSENSKENTLYWQFLKQKKIHGQQMWLLNSILDFYSDSDSFKTQLEHEVLRQQKDYYRFLSSLMVNYSAPWAVRFINLERFPISQKDGYNTSDLVNLWWEGIDLSNREILSLPSFNGRLWAYLEEFFNEDFDKEEQETHFIQGIDALMSLELTDSSTEFLRERLLSGFYESGYHEVIEHLEVTPFGDLPPLKGKVDIDRLLDQPVLRVGQRALDFKVTTADGSEKLLSQLDADYILIFFWSTWCPHCIEVMPQLHKLYTQYRDEGVEVVAVSINEVEDEQLWKDYIQKMGLQWINVRESYMDGSEVLYKYRVEATPMMYLLDKELIVISRPDTRRQLRARLRKLF